MSHKIKRLFIIIVLIPIILCIGYLLLNLYVFASSSICAKEFLYSYPIKREILENAPDPRIIFVGDSNLLFGIDSEQIKQELSYNPVNMGSIGNVGLRYDIAYIRSALRAGDIVVISPSFEQFVDKATSFNSEKKFPHLWLLMVMDIGNLRYLSSMTQLEYIVKINIEKLSDRLNSGKLLSPDCEQAVFYDLDFLNAYGDYVDPASEFSLGRDYSRRNIKQAVLSEEVVDYLNDFADDVRQKNITVFFAYPSYAQGFYKDGEKISLIDEALRTELNFPLLGEGSRYYLPNEMLFDTQYHPTHQGRTQRTQRLIEDLQIALSDKS